MPVNEDKRGLIMSWVSDCFPYEEVAIFHTQKGKARGGCIHNLNDEYTCVISGMVEYVIGANKLLLKDGESTIIPRATPHYFTSLTDSVVLEWGATKAEKLEKHKEYRAIVDGINDSAD